MFNVKFCSFYDTSSTNQSSTTTAISCPHYNIYKRNDGTYTVTTYNTMTDIDGVERHIMSDDQAKTSSSQHYHACYIENSSGKTIEHIRTNES